MSLPALAPRPAPKSQPPYDEFRRTALLRVAGRPAQQLPLEPDPTDGGLALAGATLDAFFGPQPTPSHELPSPTSWSRRFLQAAMEALAGLRAVGQLRASAAPLVYERLRHMAQRHRPARPLTPPMVQSVRVCEPADGVAEVAAVVRHGDRSRAVAARIEGIDGAWRCVSLTLL